MAKKNSSKTVTKEAISNSEPRVITFSGWTGINIADTPLDAEERDISVSPQSWIGKGQSDSKQNFLNIQNNLISCANGTICTRYENEKIAPPPPDSELTGVAICYEDYIYASAETDGEDTLWRIPLQADNVETDWEQIILHDRKGTGREKKITSIQVFIEKLIVLVEVDKVTNDNPNPSVGEIFRGNLTTLIEPDDPDPDIEYGIYNEKYIENPVSGIKISSVGDIHSASDDGVSRFRFIYTVTNAFGSTQQSDPSKNQVMSGGSYVTQADVYSKLSISQFDSGHYFTLSGNVSDLDLDTHIGKGVDIYVTVNESNKYIFIGHAELSASFAWQFNWLGAMMDSTELTTSSITVPELNTTDGVDATHMDQYDGRIYFYGGSKKYRLYIGGNAGAELSVATGLGGAFVDIEQGSGQEIRKVLKFKTYNGATTISILTHHHNTNKSSRYNLVENTIQLTNEYSTTGYYAEKVDSVIGTSSYNGADTFLDGLYAVSRYGIYFTTKAQENQNNIKMMYCSDNIEPVFTSLLGYQISGSVLLCIKDTIYLLIAQEDGFLDDFLFCYNTETKAWSTRTIFDILLNQPSIKHMFHIDSMNHLEGIGLITRSTPNQRNGGIYLIPTTGNDYEMYYDPATKKPKRSNTGRLLYPGYTSLFETHNLSTHIPNTDMFYLLQLGIYFDFLCAPSELGGLDIWVEGFDYYGRNFKVVKNVREDVLTRQNTIYLRVDRYVENFKVFIKGKAHYRLTHINMKCYNQSSTIATVYGHNTWAEQKKQHGIVDYDHHKIRNYNNLKDIILT